ncbi:MAG: site-specific integrase [Nanoarchaeota archaeon]|nr:site-specific integrase [Nanoarchaeota archaeon]
MEKIDPYKHKERYLRWKEKIQSTIPEISKENSDLILQYLRDMENGVNIARGVKKGSRSYIRLNTLRQRMVFLSKEFKARFDLDILTGINEAQLFEFFQDLRSGKIARRDGKTFKSVKDFAKDFKAFWHWYQKRNKKIGNDIFDISADLDVTGEKPEWVYLTEDEIKKLAEASKYYYKVLIWFLFDSGIRAPTELMNIKVSDFFNDFKELNIRQEISKTFGRRVKLLICHQLIKEFVKNNNLGNDSYLFTTMPYDVNKYLKRLGKRVLGDEKSPAGEKYSNITMYDFRHCSCCYWLPRYKSESALKYRFGWKKSEKIHYYSELLGMKDTISEEDLLIDVTKIELERRIDKAEKENQMLKEDNEQMKIQIATIAQLTAEMYAQMKEIQELEA